MGTWAQISAASSDCLRAAQSALDAVRSRRSHVVVETADGSAGFALFGGYRARHQFGRRYLATQEKTRSRIVLHRPTTADDCRSLARRYGLVVFCGDSAPPDLAAELLSIPVLVDLDMQTPAVCEGPGALWNRSAKANIAKVKRGRFEFDVLNGDGWVTEFHRHMYKPATRSRHGPEAYVDRRRAQAQLARTAGSELLRVLQDGKWVAGSINRSTPDGYRLAKIGWLEGEEGLLQRGVVSAVYWFSFQLRRDPWRSAPSAWPGRTLLRRWPLPLQEQVGCEAFRRATVLWAVPSPVPTITPWVLSISAGSLHLDAGR